MNKIEEFALALKNAPDKDLAEKEFIEKYKSIVSQNNLDYYITQIETSETKPKNLERFKELQGFAFNYFTELSEDALYVSVGMYLEENETFDGIVIPERFLTEDELYGNGKEDVTEFSFADYLASENENYFEDKKIPKNTKAIALKSYDKISEDKKDAFASFVKETYGFDPKTNTFVILKTDNNIILESTKEDLEELKKNTEVIAERYSVDKTALDAYLQDCSEAEVKESLPLVIDKDKLVALYIESLTKQKQYLAPLAGLIRRLKVTKETLLSIEKAYSVFDNSVLEHWLAAAPEKEVVEAQAEVTVIPQITAESEDDNADKAKPKENNNTFVVFPKKKRKER